MVKPELGIMQFKRVVIEGARKLINPFSLRHETSEQTLIPNTGSSREKLDAQSRLTISEGMSVNTNASTSGLTAVPPIPVIFEPAKQRHGRMKIMKRNRITTQQNEKQERRKFGDQNRKPEQNLIQARACAQKSLTFPTNHGISFDMNVRTKEDPELLTPFLFHFCPSFIQTENCRTKKNPERSKEKRLQTVSFVCLHSHFAMLVYTHLCQLLSHRKQENEIEVD